MVRVIKTITAFNAQPSVVGRAVAAFYKGDFVVLDVVGQLAADTAKRTQRGNLFVWHCEGSIARRHQRARGASLHTFTAGHAGRSAQGVIHVKHDFCVFTAKGQANHIIDLLVAARTQAACALYAGVQIDGNGRVRKVLAGLLASFKARLANAQFCSPLVNFIVAGVLFCRHV